MRRLLRSVGWLVGSLTVALVLLVVAAVVLALRPHHAQPTVDASLVAAARRAAGGGSGRVVATEYLRGDRASVLVLRADRDGRQALRLGLTRSPSGWQVLSREPVR